MTKLAERSIQPPRHANKLANFYDLQDRLRESTASLAPSHFSEDRFEFFLVAMENALDGNTVVNNLFPIIKGGS